VLYKAVIIIMPPTVPKGAMSVNFVHPSVRLSVTYIANNSRTQRPSVPKFGMKVPHLRTVKGWGYRRGGGAGAYCVGRTRRPHCLLLLEILLLLSLMTYVGVAVKL